MSRKYSLSILSYTTSFEASYLILSLGFFFRILSMVQMGLWATLTLNPFRTFAILSENPLAYGRIARPRFSNNVGTGFFFCIRFVTITNKIDRIVVSGHRFQHTFRFRWYFLLGEWNVLCTIHRSENNREFMLRTLVRIEIQIVVGVSGFYRSVNTSRPRSEKTAIEPSSCLVVLCLKKRSNPLFLLRW